MPEMPKCFYLDPKSKYKGDPRAKASRMAMYVYAAWIKHVEPEESKELIKWSRAEEVNDFALVKEKNGKDL